MRHRRICLPSGVPESRKNSERARSGSKRRPRFTIASNGNSWRIVPTGSRLPGRSCSASRLPGRSCSATWIVFRRHPQKRSKITIAHHVAPSTQAEPAAATSTDPLHLRPETLFPVRQVRYLPPPAGRRAYSSLGDSLSIERPDCPAFDQLQQAAVPWACQVQAATAQVVVDHNDVVPPPAEGNRMFALRLLMLAATYVLANLLFGGLPHVNDCQSSPVASGNVDHGKHLLGPRPPWVGRHAWQEGRGAGRHVGPGSAAGPSWCGRLAQVGTRFKNNSPTCISIPLADSGTYDRLPGETRRAGLVVEHLDFYGFSARDETWRNAAKPADFPRLVVGG